MKRLENLLKKYALNRITFKIMILIAVMMTAVPYLHMIMGAYVKIILLYGILLIVYEIFHKQYKFVLNDKANIILILFCISYLITIIVNRDLNFFANLKALAYMAVFFVLLYMDFQEKENRELIKEVEIISWVETLTTFCLSAAAFATYALGISGSYITDTGITRYGMYQNRLWGVYNANIGATLNVVSLIISVTFIVTHKKKKTYCIIHFVNIVLQYCCLILTGSRGPMYSLYAVVIIAIVFQGIKRIVACAEVKKKMKQILICWVVCIAALGGFTLCNSVSKNILAYVPAITEVVTKGIDITEDGFTLKKYDLNRAPQENNFTSSRTIIWKAAWEGFKKSPVWGVTRENVYDATAEYLEGTNLHTNVKNGGVHSIYMCVLLSSGIVGFILLAIFAIALVLRTVTAIVRNIQSVNPWAVTCFLMIMMFLITELVEGRILYQASVFCVLFWMYSGYSMSFTRILNSQKNEMLTMED